MTAVFLFKIFPQVWNKNALSFYGINLYGKTHDNIFQDLSCGKKQHQKSILKGAVTMIDTLYHLLSVYESTHQTEYAAAIRWAIFHLEQKFGNAS